MIEMTQFAILLCQDFGIVKNSIKYQNINNKNILAFLPYCVSALLARAFLKRK